MCNSPLKLCWYIMKTDKRSLLISNFKSLYRTFVEEECHRILTQISHFCFSDKYIVRMSGNNERSANNSEVKSMIVPLQV